MVKLENKSYLLVRNELSIIGKLVLRGTRIVVPTNLRERVLHLAHEGHPGIVSVKRVSPPNCGGQDMTRRPKGFVKPVVLARSWGCLTHQNP